MNPEEQSRQHLQALLDRYAGAIEYWTLACLSREELGHPATYVEEQWMRFQNELQSLRMALAGLERPPSPVVHEQVANLMRLAVELREIFELLLRHGEHPAETVEQAVLRLGVLWKELRLRVTLAAAAIPLAPPLPSVSTDQERYYQGILDGLFDRFANASQHGE